MQCFGFKKKGVFTFTESIVFSQVITTTNIQTSPLIFYYNV